MIADLLHHGYGEFYETFLLDLGLIDTGRLLRDVV